MPFQTTDPPRVPAHKPSVFPSFEPNSLILQFDTPDFYLAPREPLPVPSLTKRVKFEQADSDRVLAQSIRETKMVQAATPDDLFALLSLEKHLASSRQHIHDMHELTAPQWEAWRLCRAVNQRQACVNFLQDARDGTHLKKQSCA